MTWPTLWRHATISLGQVTLALVTLGGGGTSLSAPVGSGLPLFGGRLYPTLGIDQHHESNYLRVSEGRLPNGARPEELSTWVTILRPRLNWSSFSGERSARSVRLEYGADIGTVYSSPNDNYIDQRFNASANLEVNMANRVRGEYEFLRWHDRRGSEDPQDVSRINVDEHPDLWKSNRFLTGWSIGRPGREDVMDFWIAHHARRYINNDQELRDNDRITLNATLSRLVLPKTRGLVQMTLQDIQYIRQRAGIPNRDSIEQILYLGTLWDISRKTSVSVKGGYLAKDFENPQLKDVGTFGWDLALRWRPHLERAVLDISTDRQTYESAELYADSTVISVYQVNWLHHIRTNRIWYELGGWYTTDDYVDSDRIDNRWHLRTGLYGRMAQRFLLGLQYQHERRDSDLPEARYNNDRVMLTLELGL